GVADDHRARRKLLQFVLLDQELARALGGAREGGVGADRPRCVHPPGAAQRDPLGDRVRLAGTPGTAAVPAAGPGVLPERAPAGPGVAASPAPPGRLAGR